MTIGLTRNPYEKNVSTGLIAAAGALGTDIRVIDLQSVRATVAAHGEAQAFDQDGPIVVDSLAPFLLFGFPAAIHAYRVLAASAYVQNSVGSTLTADDKASTAQRLAQAGVPQVRTEIVSFDATAVHAAATRLGYPVVVKRTHGAQGRWVRRAEHPTALDAAVQELAVEGPGALVVQPEVVECEGRSIRAVFTGGELLACTERIAGVGEWRSNIARGARQHRTTLTDEERSLAGRSMRAMGLRHAGIDILRTAAGPRILEVNSCPDFTSMQPHHEANLAVAVLRASMRPARPGGNGG